MPARPSPASSPPQPPSRPSLLSTGLNAAGNLITTNNTNDASLDCMCRSPTLPSETAALRSPRQPAPRSRCSVVGPGDAGWYSGWPANGPHLGLDQHQSQQRGRQHAGVYSTTRSTSRQPLCPANLCLVGAMGIDDNGLLALNGTAIMGNIKRHRQPHVVEHPHLQYLVVGTNTLALGWGSHRQLLRSLPPAGQSSRPAAPASPAA
jgi:hypothetical protein